VAEAWAFEYSVACPVTTEFAWRFWTDVNNWRLDTDVESVELNGPFAAGSRGVSRRHAKALRRDSGEMQYCDLSFHAAADCGGAELNGSACLRRAATH
jgi:hypothetical protein